MTISSALRRGALVALLSGSFPLLMSSIPSAAAQSGSAAKVPVTINLAMTADYDNLSPYKTKFFAGYQVATAFYDRLVALDREGKVIPFLASSWKATATEATFNIRNDIVCSDGTPLTPKAIAASIQHLADPATNAPYRVRTFGAGKVTTSYTDSTVTISLSKPYNEMLVGLAMPWAGIVCPSGLANLKGIESMPVGSGPYTLDAGKSVRGSHYTMHRRTDYHWGPSGTTSANLPDTLVMHVVQNGQTLARQLVSGSLDIGIVAPTDSIIADRNKKLTRTLFPFNGSYFLMVRQPPGSPWSDANLRKALAMSFDHASVTKIVGLGHFKPAKSFLSNALPCYGVADDSMLKFNQDKAKQLLEQAGYKKNSNGKWAKDGVTLRIRFIAPTTPYPTANAKLLKDFLAFGFDASLQEMDFGALFDAMPNRANWDIALFPYGPPIPTYSSADSFLVSTGGNNYSKINNSQFDELAAKGIMSEPQSEEQCKIWKAAQTQLVSDANIIPLFTPSGSVYTDAKLDAKQLVSFGGASIVVTSIHIAQ